MDRPRGPDTPEPPDNGDDPDQPDENSNGDHTDQPRESDQPRDNDQPDATGQPRKWYEFELKETDADVDTRLAVMEKQKLQAEGFGPELLDELYGTDAELGIDQPDQPDEDTETDTADASVPADAEAEPTDAGNEAPAAPAEAPRAEHHHRPGPDTWTSTDTQRPDHDPENHAWVPAIRRPEWQDDITSGRVDVIGWGIVDERAEPFLPHERRTADYVAAEGPAVVSRFEDHGIHAKKPDADVDGVPTEFKALGTDQATHATVLNTLNRGKEQAQHTIIDARGSGLTEDDAARGIRRFIGTPHAHNVNSIRIIGDDFDHPWRRGD